MKARLNSTLKKSIGLAPVPSIPALLGHSIFRCVNFLGGMFLLLKNTVKELMTKPFYTSLVIEQIYQTGIRSFPLVFVTALSIGMVMALQFGIGLEKFGGKLYVPKIVSVSIIRELGPAFTSLMLASRVAAGIASEVGSMQVTQQIDAIKALGTSPIKKIVIPRVLGVLIALPILTVLANIIGIAGGMFVGTTELGLDAEFYIKKLSTTLKVTDYLSGMAKTPFFALFIGFSGCYYGLNTGKGTKGVGIATTKAVVTSSIFIFISDYFLTKAFVLIENIFQ